MKKDIQPKFKIGVLIQSFKLNKFEKEIIDFLSSESKIELYAILEKKKINNFSNKINYALKKNSILRNLEILFFKIITFLEEFLLKIKYKELKELEDNYFIKKNQFKEILKVNPIYSKKGIYSEYNSFDYNKIKDKNLDLVIRINASEIFRNNKLNIAKLGILSFHHGDNSWNRGGPPGFWEVFLNKPQTGFIIQYLSKKLDNGKILSKGEFFTKRLFTLNKYNLYKESNFYLIKVVKEILSNKNSLRFNNSSSNSKVYKIPNFLVTIRYIYKKFFLYFRLFNKKYLQNKKHRWFVSYSRSNFNKLKMKDLINIKNLSGRYFADPFVVDFKEKNYIFVEDYSYKDKKGSISVIEIDKNDNQKIFEKIIEEPFHMSFPFVFQHNGIFYMVPETSGSDSLKLYKCLNFPDKWIFCYDLISNIRCVDNIIFKKEKLYYLLNTKSYYNDFSSQLNVYYSDSPISKNWVKHKLNPIYFTSKKGRNGGFIFQNNNLVRVAQNNKINHLGDNQYGREISLNNITDISPDLFKEEFIKKIKPTVKENILGIHHMSGIKDFTVFDYCKYDKIT